MNVERHADQVTITMSRREAADALEDLENLSRMSNYNRAMLVESLRERLVTVLGSDANRMRIR